MIRAVAVLLLFAHGVAHFAIWVPRVDPGRPPPFRPDRSGLLSAAGMPEGAVRRAAVTLAVVTGLLNWLAAVWLVTGSDRWAGAAVGAAVCGLVLKAIWFNPWLSLGVVLDLGLLLAVAQRWPAALW
ncbi:hypothetical protein GCM10027160_02910 [Streptomyces calidiresistens]|uniref:Uncharacterized protein n=1 Tax=Streptomyces calidiresistens TaxID=1485586 RepID=A0A7W3T5F9_9ACTN|nr:hypothetical protein [Streptomyces calidiresistens]MBB0231303.1 hypothetical protein [Streptomyces calidiresistens]